MSYHMVARNWIQDLKEQPVLLTMEPSISPVPVSHFWKVYHSCPTVCPPKSPPRYNLFPFEQCHASGYKTQATLKFSVFLLLHSTPSQCCDWHLPPRRPVHLLLSIHWPTLLCLHCHSYHCHLLCETRHHFIVPADLELLLILLPQPPKCGDYRPDWSVVTCPSSFLSLASGEHHSPLNF